MRLFAGAVNIGKKDTRSAVNDWSGEAGVYSPETVEDFFQAACRVTALDLQTDVACQVKRAVSY